MTWLMLILLVLGGLRDPDVRYEQACERLGTATAGHLTCDLLEDLLGREGGEVEPPRVGISNGF